MISHILVGSDGTASAVHALETAVEIAEKFGSQLTLAYLQPSIVMSTFAEVPVTKEIVELEQAGFDETNHSITDQASNICDKRRVKFDCVVAQGTPVKEFSISQPM
jgi:nucleotide-binding universal stress UspA family protein